MRKKGSKGGRNSMSRWEKSKRERGEEEEEEEEEEEDLARGRMLAN